LSYTWAKNDSTRVFWLDDQESMINISDDLDTALRCLRHGTESRFVWIDFICINQDDLEERKQQVELMYQIYSEARKVIIYLGPQKDGSEDMPKLFESIRKAHHNSTAIDASVRKPWTEEEWVALGLPPLKDSIWAQMARFLSRPWFRRVWIIQEVLAAKEIYVICGLWLVNARSVFEATYEANMHGLPHSGTRGPHDELLQRPVLLAGKQLEFMVGLGLCGILESDRPSTLLDLLEGTRNAQATDPRDRVYALLNLCKDAVEPRIAPDYTIDVEQTYEFLARTLIEAGQGSRLLLSAGELGSNLGLPSWVPDWSLQHFSLAPIVSSEFNFLEADPKGKDNSV
jgi:hypothetical protein